MTVLRENAFMNWGREDYQKGLNTKRPPIVFIWVPRNLSHHMIRKTAPALTVRTETLSCVVVVGGEGVKTTENKIHRPRWVIHSSKTSRSLCL
jgi:hypothetical protein